MSYIKKKEYASYSLSINLLFSYPSFIKKNNSTSRLKIIIQPSFNNIHKYKAICINFGF